MPPRVGFDFEAYQAALKKVELPDKVKCKVCKKIRPQQAFSKRQLEEFRKVIAKHGAGVLSAHAACRSCTGQQVVELTCYVCDKTKTLEYFSKNQRRDPDSARCTNCVQGHLDSEPIMEDTKLLLDDDNVIEALADMGDALAANSFRALTVGTDGNTPAASKYGVTSDRTAMLSYKTSAKGKGRDDGQDENEGLLDGGVWLEQGPVIDSRLRPGLPFPTIDANGKAHFCTISTPSEGATAAPSGWDLWKNSGEPSTRTRTPSQAQDVYSDKNAKFAKVNGFRLPKELAPSLCLPEPTGRTVESDSEDSEEDVENWI
ncbi:hypothetical protein LOZ39_000109 [Ophidiomyces ophidiicola]|nr:hypothetical protein LOZ55_001371 [Ophidiomyces ophidiicola]KAI1999523.1 hypothetical protein LOZ51_002011 [Ophidiomyces ophidiicola]KAI2011633.1 hypothetical protein LOZ50_000654 [Ophidiomyces ophidiicola]KAI2056473.1 hypothetical protein LOZ38_000224 [Ophidiomyces ophidiicola]KAI2082145.1 hypothetical protein LOZ39_000109 [Ophidiomyces ophidiicola]